MEPINLRLTLNEEDWLAYLMAAGQRASAAAANGSARLLRWLPLAFVIVLSVLMFIGYATGHWGRLGLVALASAGVMAWLFQICVRASVRPAAQGLFLGEVELDAGPAGLRVRKTQYQSEFRWTAETEVTVTPSHVFIWLDKFSGHPLPIRELPSRWDAESLAAAIRGFISARGVVAAGQPLMTASSAPDAALVEAAAAAPQPAAVVRVPTIAQELAQVLKLLLAGNARPDLLQGREMTIALLGAAALTAMILLERLGISGSAEFFLYNIPAIGWMAGIGLAFSWLVAKIAWPALTFRRVLLLACAFALFASLATGIGSLFGWVGLCAAYGLVIVEFAIFFSRANRVLTGNPQLRAMAGGAALLALIYFVNQQFYFTPSFWVESEPEETAEAPGALPSARREQLAFDQALLVDDSVRAIRRGDDPGAQFFFLGFAGYGEQRVFAEEVGFAATQVHQRFDTERRSMRLVNDRRDLEKFPWASSSALNSSLRGIARVMDVETDVLFLALSSHGSEEGYISVNDGQPFTRDLYAEDLARMLRESGIRWKIIVVSACHAGTFIEPLKDENTVVITAAAADKTSFGCSDDRDLTYFGEAFYRDALPDSANLRGAFETARAMIRKREAAEGISASDPQAFFGTAIERKLAELEEAVVAAR